MYDETHFGDLAVYGCETVEARRVCGSLRLRAGALPDAVRHVKFVDGDFIVECGVGVELAWEFPALILVRGNIVVESADASRLSFPRLVRVDGTVSVNAGGTRTYMDISRMAPQLRSVGGLRLENCHAISGIVAGTLEDPFDAPDDFAFLPLLTRIGEGGLHVSDCAVCDDQADRFMQALRYVKGRARVLRMEGDADGALARRIGAVCAQ